MDPRHASLAGKVALVTGAGAGIGRAIAETFVAFGAGVALLELDADRLARTADALGAAGGAVVATAGDARSADDLARALAAAETRFGPVHVLVNNVGGVFRRDFLDSPEKAWDALLRVNLRSVLAGTQVVGRHMRAHGRGGSIVNLVTIEAARAAPGYAVYAAAKAAVASFTKTMALELAPFGVRVNALAPDVCWTEGLAALVGAAERERFAANVPLGRVGEGDDVAGAALFLASDLSRYVTGVVLPVDGGTSAAGGWYRDGDDWILGPPRGPRSS